MHFAIGTVRDVGAVLLCLCLHQACAAHKLTVLHPVLGKPVPTLQAAVPTALRIAKKHRSTGAFFALCFPPETHSAGFGFCAQAGGSIIKPRVRRFLRRSFSSGRDAALLHIPRATALFLRIAHRANRMYTKNPAFFAERRAAESLFQKRFCAVIRLRAWHVFLHTIRTNKCPARSRRC